MDPQLTPDGRPYAPVRFKALSNERYLVSKFCNSSYTDVGNMTPREREYILEFILKDLQREKDARDAVRGK